jgi:hypothetical protein
MWLVRLACFIWWRQQRLFQIEGLRIWAQEFGLKGFTYVCWKRKCATLSKVFDFSNELKISMCLYNLRRFYPKFIDVAFNNRWLSFVLTFHERGEFWLARLKGPSLLYIGINVNSGKKIIALYVWGLEMVFTFCILFITALFVSSKFASYAIKTKALRARFVFVYLLPTWFSCLYTTFLKVLLIDTLKWQKITLEVLVLNFNIIFSFIMGALIAFRTVI